ncbi:MAG: bacillithiol system redox-active protein YtxJ [Thermomicrobiales bacterium]|nr:bacillithiol system redox-active protein YtxJ [Thermomicrobiales bacterium]
MPETYTQVASVSDLDEAFEKSANETVVLFNHDPWCPISGRAFKEMAQVEYPTRMVDVSKAHDVSSALAERTGVKHESPQVIVLRDGQPKWNASHFAITADSVTNAIASAGEVTGSLSE